MAELLYWIALCFTGVPNKVATEGAYCEAILICQCGTNVLSISISSL